MSTKIKFLLAKATFVSQATKAWSAPIWFVCCIAWS